LTYKLFFWGHIALVLLWWRLTVLGFAFYTKNTGTFPSNIHVCSISFNDVWHEGEGVTIGITAWRLAGSA
jgi:hypothetical protein